MILPGSRSTSASPRQSTLDLVQIRQLRRDRNMECVGNLRTETCSCDRSASQGIHQPQSTPPASGQGPAKMCKLRHPRLLIADLGKCRTCLGCLGMQFPDECKPAERRSLSEGGVLFCLPVSRVAVVRLELFRTNAGNGNVVLTELMVLGYRVQCS